MQTTIHLNQAISAHS